MRRKVATNLHIASTLRLAGLTATTIVALACASDPGPEDGAGETGDGLPCQADSDCPDAAVCIDGVCEAASGRRPYRDVWREELVMPLAELRKLTIGGRLSNDNFSNRGDIEVLYVPDMQVVRVELQRFTVASSLAEAEQAWSRMSLWAYDLAGVEPPSDAIADDACGSGGETCQLRTYYDGLYQPLRDGANIRVTLPEDWSGALELETEDNLHEGGYPDRGDIRVDGLRGSLHAVLDSGRVTVRLHPSYDYYPLCQANDDCVALGLAPGCGCSEFGNLRIEARSGQAADILVDVADVDKYYTARLQNDDPILELGCSVEIDCEAFADCGLDPSFENVAAIERAAINYPGEPAVPGTGIHLDLRSGSCAMIEHAEQPADYFEGAASEVRGSVRLCAWCT